MRYYFSIIEINGILIWLYDKANNFIIYFKILLFIWFYSLKREREREREKGNIFQQKFFSSHENISLQAHRIREMDERKRRG